jgi:hypothetical protein
MEGWKMGPHGEEGVWIGGEEEAEIGFVEDKERSWKILGIS